MKKLILFLVFILVGILFVYVIASVTGVRTDSSQNKITTSTPKTILKTLTTGSLEEGDVTVKLTPFIDGERLVVKVAMNTHTVDLGQIDLKESITLEYGEVKLKPVEAKGPDGHHSDGVVVFVVGEMPASFTIKVKGIPKTSERVYEWKRDIAG